MSTGLTGRLSTHVLDTALGRPAAGLELTLSAVQGGERRQLLQTTTNEDGRTDAPLLSGEALTAGVYEIAFHAGDYLQRAHGAEAGSLFLDIVPIRFNVNDPGAHYHVPLLLSPFGYSTYRGS